MTAVDRLGESAREIFLARPVGDRRRPTMYRVMDAYPHRDVREVR
jgi:hypothetical protein